MFQLTVEAQVINLVTAFVLGFGWTIGCELAKRVWNKLFNRPQKPA